MKMKSLVSVCMMAVVVLMTTFFVDAGNRKIYDLPLEGQLDHRLDARSIVPEKSASATLIDNMLYVYVYCSIPNMTITVKDAAGETVYTRECADPDVEAVSLEGLANGVYTLELTAPEGYMYGTFPYE